jgi:putative acetyltransferase
VEIRPATPADAESVRHVHRASIEDLDSSAYTQEQVNAWARGCESADYVAAITSDDLYFIIAEDDEEVLGFGSLCFESPSEYEASVDAEITGVYVHPSVTRNGVGTEILTNLEQEARECECSTLGLSASLNAVPFYEHHDYERVRAYIHEFSRSASTGVDGQIIEMKKEL